MSGGHAFSDLIDKNRTRDFGTILSFVHSIRTHCSKISTVLVNYFYCAVDGGRREEDGIANERRQPNESTRLPTGGRTKQRGQVGGSICKGQRTRTREESGGGTTEDERGGRRWWCCLVPRYNQY